MEYILFDNFNGTLSIIHENEEPLVFTSLREAKDNLKTHCQNGQIISLDVNIIWLIKELDKSNDNERTKAHISDIIADVLDYQ